MASNIKYPDDKARWFIEGDKLCLITISKLIKFISLMLDLFSQK